MTPLFFSFSLYDTVDALTGVRFGKSWKVASRATNLAK